MSAFEQDADEESKFVTVKGRDSQFLEVFDPKTGIRIETTGAEEPKNIDTEAAILRRQSMVVMQEATNYTGFNVKIEQGKVQLANETKYLKKILMNKTQLHK